MEQTSVQQGFHQHGETAIAVDIVHHVATKWLHISNVGNLVANAVEVRKRQGDLCFVGNRQKVQNNVGRPTEGHTHRNGVFKSLHGQNVARGVTALQHAHDRLAGLVGVVVPSAVIRRR